MDPNQVSQESGFLVLKSEDSTSLSGSIYLPEPQSSFGGSNIRKGPLS